MHSKIYFELEFRQHFWKQICWINLITGCGGYILIKSDFRLLNLWSFGELCHEVPPRALPWTQKGASQPPPPTPAEISLPKKSLNTSLHVNNIQILGWLNRQNWNLKMGTKTTFKRTHDDYTQNIWIFKWPCTQHSYFKKSYCNYFCFRWSLLKSFYSKSSNIFLDSWALFDQFPWFSFVWAEKNKKLIIDLSNGKAHPPIKLQLRV